MRRKARFHAGVAATVVAATLGGAAHGPATAVDPPPKLELLKTRPVTIHGTGFRSHEHIRVVLRRPSGVLRRKTQGDGQGAFSLAFNSATIGRCGTFSITAKGRSGSRAVLLRRAPAACPPP
jgi:hypothetical protein